MHAERPGEVPAETLSDVAVGVDGCRGGWLAVGRVRGRLVHAVFPTFQALMAGRGRDDRVYIDMPIGLPGRANPTRECDRMARRFLAGRRSASVFPPPCRAAVHAPDLASARRLNLASLGRSLSAQSWNIAPRIRGWITGFAPMPDGPAPSGKAIPRSHSAPWAAQRRRTRSASPPVSRNDWHCWRPASATRRRSTVARSRSPRARMLQATTSSMPRCCGWWRWLRSGH